MSRPTEPKPWTPRRAPVVKQRWMATAVEKIAVETTTSVSFDAVFAHRRTVRRMRPTSRQNVLGLLRDVFRLRGTETQRGRIQKSVVSAGALHPIDAVVLSGPDVDDPVVYDDERDFFLVLEPSDREKLGAFISKASSLVPTARGHLLMMVGDLPLTSSVYEDGISLLWRDSGAALQVLAMAAEARGLAFCPLGLLGHDALNAIVSSDTGRIAAGTALVGRPG